MSVRIAKDIPTRGPDVNASLLATRAVIALAVDPTDPDGVYAGTDQGGLFAVPSEI